MEIVSWLSKQASKLADNFTNDYDFYVKSFPENHIDSSTIISLTTYTDNSQSAIIPCQFKWLRIKNGISEWRSQFKGNSYICDLTDVGSSLQAQITSNDSSHVGTAFLNFGPVSIDPVVKEVIRGNLSKGNALFHVQLLVSHTQIQCRFEIRKDQIIVTHEASNRSFKIPFSMNSPSFNSFHQNSSILSLTFEEYSLKDYELFLQILKIKDQNQSINQKANQITVNFSSRKVRDQFLVMVKIFNAERQLKRSHIIQKIQKIDLLQCSDLLLEIQSLRADLIKMFKAYNKERTQKYAYFSQNVKLEEQISQILKAYSILFNQTSSNSQSQHPKKHQRRNISIIQLMKSYKQLETENKLLKQKKQKENIQNEKKHEHFQYQLIMHIQQLQKANHELKNKVNQLQSNSSIQKQIASFDTSSAALEKYIYSHAKSIDLNPQCLPSTQIINKMSTQLQLPNQQLQQQLQNTLSLLEKQKQQHMKSRSKLQRKISELNDEIYYLKRKDTVINRSYSLSMELEDYNYEQNKVLRDQNDFLLSQAEKLSRLCDKYKSQCKKLKQAQRTS